LTGVGVRIAFGSTQYFTAKQNVGQVKSSAAHFRFRDGALSVVLPIVYFVVLRFIGIAVYVVLKLNLVVAALK